MTKFERVCHNCVPNVCKEYYTCPDRLERERKADWMVQP